MSKNPQQSSLTSPAKFPLGYLQTGKEDYLFLLVCVIAQAATILITWQLWQVRQDPVNLPWVAQTPQFSCGILLLGSLALVLASPRKFGVVIHLMLLLIAMTLDQFRCQPQVLCVAALMVGCTWPTARKLTIWFLISMWLWAGIHKLISPEWFDLKANFLLGPLGVTDATTQMWIAGAIAVSEIAVGLAAWWRPRLGAIACVLLHVGISVFLIVRVWNVSVLPWNFCTALVGGWMLWTAQSSQQPKPFVGRCRVEQHWSSQSIMATPSRCFDVRGACDVLHRRCAALFCSCAVFGQYASSDHYTRPKD